MFEKLKDYMLERQVRDLLERYYWRFGLTLEEAKRMPMRQLLEKMNDFLENNKNEVSYYAGVVHHLDERIQLLTISGEEMKHRMKDLQGENKGLHGELARAREDNYKLKLDNMILKQSFQAIENNKEKENAKEQSKVNDVSLAR